LIYLPYFYSIIVKEGILTFIYKRDKKHISYRMLFFKKSFFIILLIGNCLGVCGQSSRTNITNKYILKNVFIISSPGATPYKSNILIENGIIKSISNTATLPYDAKILELFDTTYVYAGFIDPHSHTAIRREDERRDVVRLASRAYATFEQSGITPQIQAASKLSKSAPSISEMRSQGFVVSQVFPNGRMLSGESAIISLKEAQEENQLILQDHGGIQASFANAYGGVSPITLLGVMAKYREVFAHTEAAIINEKNYLANPKGMKRPEYSIEIEAMKPVYRKEKLLYFITERPKDIFRAIALKKDLGFNLVLSNVKDFHGAIDELEKTKTPVLLSLILPEEPKEKQDSTKGEEHNDFILHKKESFLNMASKAASLEKKKIPFSFCYREVSPVDIHKVIKRYIDNGLSEKGALAALTTTPASLLQMDQTHGTVEVGKTANLVLTNGRLFKEKTKINIVIVDGTPYDVEARRITKAIEYKKSYAIKITSDTSQIQATLYVDDTNAKGKIIYTKFPTQDIIIADIKKEGSVISFKSSIEDKSNKYDFKFDLDSLKGTINDVEREVYILTAQKNPDKK
jgi:hypothetical protein